MIQVETSAALTEHATRDIFRKGHARLDPSHYNHHYVFKL